MNDRWMIVETNLTHFLDFLTPPRSRTAWLWSIVAVNEWKRFIDALRTINDSCMKYAIFPQETQVSLLFVGAAMESLNVTIPSQIIFYGIIWRCIQKLCDNFRNGGRSRFFAGYWKKSKKRETFFVFFSKIFSKKIMKIRKIIKTAFWEKLLPK